MRGSAPPLLSYLTSVNSGWYLIRNEHAERTEDLYSKVTHFFQRDSERAACGIQAPLNDGRFKMLYPKKRSTRCIACKGALVDGPVGPIERELRSGSVQLANWQCSARALLLCSGAASQLGFPTMLDAYNKNAWPDVLTEAICAAAEWNL